MRVAYVCADPGVPVFGRKGCSVHVQEVIRALRRLGARVELFAARTGGERPPGLKEVEVHPLPAPAKGDPASRERAALAANDDLRRALDRAGRFDLVYERYSLWSFAGMEHAGATGAPGLLEVNAPLIEEQVEFRGLADSAGAEGVARRAFAAADVLLAVSDGVADYLNRRPETVGRVHVVPNGVDLDRFLPPTSPAPDRPFTVGFVGTLKSWHGLDVLVEAFAQFRRRRGRGRLLVVGDGTGREGLEADLERRGLAGEARLTGAVDPADVPGLIAEMDAAVAPYPPRAGFYFSPLKLFEYMAAGRAVVASRIGQVAELVEDGVNGLLCPPGDPAALAAALGRLAGDPALRARLGRAARETVRRGHTWDAVARRVLRLAGVGPAVACSGRGD